MACKSAADAAVFFGGRGVPVLGCPCNKLCNISKSILGLLICGNSHITIHGHPPERVQRYCWHHGSRPKTKSLWFCTLPHRGGISGSSEIEPPQQLYQEYPQFLFPTNNRTLQNMGSCSLFLQCPALAGVQFFYIDMATGRRDES